MRIDGKTWAYATEDGDGFTTDVQNARHVDGKPVLCTGFTRYVSEKYIENQKKLWEALLDKMEEIFELEERPESKEVRKALALGREHETALVRSLAILIYGADRDGTIAIVRAQANARYDQ